MSYEYEMWKPWEQRRYEQAMREGKMGSKEDLRKLIATNTNQGGREIMKGDVIFDSRIVDTGGANEQVVVYVKHDGSENSKELCRLYPKGEHYNRGLEKSFKSLVNVRGIAENIATVLQAHHDIERLTSVTYGNIIEAYNPFVDKWLKYERVLDFIDKTEGDDWI